MLFLFLEVNYAKILDLMVISEDIDVSSFILSLGEQQVPLVEYGAAGRTQPSGLDQLRYPAVSVGPTSHPGYYGEMHATAPPLNYYEGHTQLPSHVEGPSSQPPEFKNMTVPPPSYEDVMQNKKAY